MQSKIKRKQHVVLKKTEQVDASCTPFNSLKISANI